jgi:hypothetical protein
MAFGGFLWGTANRLGGTVNILGTLFFVTAGVILLKSKRTDLFHASLWPAVCLILAYLATHHVCSSVAP